MPFFPPFKDEPSYINHDIYKPIDVIFCTHSNGKIEPMRCKYVLPDESVETINIDGISITKDIRGGVSFSCVATMYGKRINFTLAYFYVEHTWYIAR